MGLIHPLIFTHTKMKKTREKPKLKEPIITMNLPKKPEDREVLPQIPNFTFQWPATTPTIWETAPSKSIQATPSESISIVIAIDFGTSRSGFAYAFIKNPKIDGNTKWEEAPGDYYKTLTHILYSPERKPIAWGWKALKHYMGLQNTNIPNADSYKPFSNFKMLLHEGTDKTKDGPYFTKDGKRVRDANGHGFLVLDLIADYLKVLKDNAKRLFIVLEPEAAVIYCMKHYKGTNLSTLDQGKCFMVVDCGGGTVDITVHEIAEHEELKEVVPPEGGPYGSTYIDRYFFEGYLPKKLTKEVIEIFRKQENSDYLRMRADWELKKCGFNPQSSWNTLIPLGTLYKKMLIKYPQLLQHLREKQ